MATKIVTKNSSTASAVPTASDLVQGELAVNVADKRLFTEDNTGTIVELGTNPSTIDINAGTIDGAVIGGTTPAAITGSTVTSTGNIVVTGTVDGRDVAADGTKLDGIEANADVTDTLNVTAAGALMDSELTSEASVKALNQGVATTDSPAFAGLTVDTNTLYVDSTNNRVGIGTSPLYPFHVQTPSDGSTGAVFRYIGGTNNPGLFFSTNESTRDCVINATGSTSANLVFSTTSERMRIDSSGNVGIGTTSPSHLLDAVGASGSISSMRVANPDVGVRLSAYTNAFAELRVETNHPLLFKTNGNNERMRIDSSGRVGIGTSSPSRPLYVQESGTGSSRGISINTATAGGNAGIGFATAGTDRFSIDTVGSSGSEALRVYSWTASTERARIDSSGNLLVGTTLTAPTTGGIVLYKDSTRGIVRSGTNITSADAVAAWYNPNGKVGQIVTSGSSTSYNTSSDQRLKENIADADDAGSKIDAIQVRQYDWKVDGSHQDYGMIAQELQTVAPEAVSGDADSEEMMGVDYSKLVPMLIKEIQSLRNRVAQLEE